MKRVIVAVAVFLVLAAGTALAATPVGQWNFRGFDGPDHVQGPRQGICFAADGTWYSTTFVGWQRTMDPERRQDQILWHHRCSFHG